MKKIYLFIVAVFVALNMTEAQTFNRQANINLQVTTDTILYPFDGNNITSIGVSGQVEFTSDYGFVRFFVSDGNGDDYLVYEAYKMFEDASTISFSQKCEESCFYDTYTPSDFIIQVKDAIVNINSVDFSNTHYSNAEYQRLDAATSADNIRLAKVQSFIERNGLIWIADHTKLSDLSFASKTQLWGKDYKSYGFEYYSGGFYCLEQPHRGIDYGDDFATNFDWRNRHGANNPNSPYYDGDIEGSGWLSPLTCQLGCYENGVFSCGTEDDCPGNFRSAGTCWSFGPTAQVEALANLYYNFHLDLDLSEQYPVCKEAEAYNWESIKPWDPNYALNYYWNGGVPYESCWPYTAGLDGCEPPCSEPMERVSINSYTCYNEHNHNEIGVDELKHLIMEKGPVAAASIPDDDWITHCMLLVGWGTIDEDSPGVSNLPDNFNDRWYGVTYWIYKNSYGVSSDHNMFDGYSYIIHDYTDEYHTQLHVPKSVFEIPVPINVPGLSSSDIRCEDKDGDGYYYWGIGPKPAQCPPCPDEPDGDDSNPCLGPLNEKGQCTIINTYNSSFENGWDNWIQKTYTDFGQDDFDWWRHSGPTNNHSNGGQPTGPQQAQDGDFYIYVDGSTPSFTGDKAFIMSPPIDFSSLDACSYMIDFYYHMNSSNWGNPEKNELHCMFYKDGLPIKSVKVAADNQGDEWEHATIFLPDGTDQIYFYSVFGRAKCDIALDNITIGPWNHEDNPIVITDNTIWNESGVFNQDIIVENGGKLTIKKVGSSITMKMHPESKIIVKPGGQLILDGCKLVCSCPSDLWQGIQVWGDKTKDQQMHNGSYYQGYLEMKNNASIEDAICAVELWNPNHWSSTGGVIHANNAIFNNNAKSVHALNYQYIQNGKVVNYNAKFTECTFTIGVGYNNLQPFYKHVDLANVQGVRFAGCTFRIEEDVQNISDWTIGIAAYNAGFTVDAIYQAQTNGFSVKKRSSFSGFQRAIQSVDDGINKVPEFTVKHADFRKNDYGIFSRKGNYATIVDCSFELGLDDWYSCNAGIYLDNTTGFAIEENSFTKGRLAVDDNFGIVIKDSQSQNQIYHNDFDGLYCGNLAIDINNVGFGQEYYGTEYVCNENANNDIDFYVLAKDQHQGYLRGIQSYQGKDIAATRNTFSDDAYHFYNGGDYLVTYAYYNASGTSHEEPIRYNGDKFIPKPSYQTDGCPSRYGDSNPITPVIPDTRKQQLEQDYYNAYSPYSLIKNVYENRIDGGSTNSTVADIKTARPSDMWQLRSKLLGSSPYLSQDVLFAAADRDDVFSESVLFEIMLSNPDELKKDTLMRYLGNKAHPLPEYMISILEQVATGTSAKTVLQNQMASYRKQFSQAAGDIVRSIINDSLVDLAELRGWLGNLNDIHADRDIIATFVAEGDFGNAFALAELLPNLYGLEGAALQEHDDYMDLLHLYQNLHNSNRGTMQLTDSELNQVEDVADNGTGTSRAMAKAMLEGAYDYHFEDCPVAPYPDGDRSASSNYVSPEDLGKALGFTVSLKPNPATTWTAIDYTLPSDGKTAVVEITNALGVKVMQLLLNGHEGQKVLDLRELSNGVYTMTVLCGEYYQTEKLVISK